MGGALWGWSDSLRGGSHARSGPALSPMRELPPGVDEGKPSVAPRPAPRGCGPGAVGGPRARRRGAPEGAQVRPPAGRARRLAARRLPARRPRLLARRPSLGFRPLAGIHRLQPPGIRPPPGRVPVVDDVPPGRCRFPEGPPAPGGRRFPEAARTGQSIASLRPAHLVATASQGLPAPSRQRFPATAAFRQPSEQPPPPRQPSARPPTSQQPPAPGSAPPASTHLGPRLNPRPRTASSLPPPLPRSQPHDVDP